MKLIAVGTHHKTGTHWMADVFSSFASYSGYSFLNLSTKKSGDINSLLESKVKSDKKGLVVFHNHSVFPDFLYSTSFKGIHMIRDPRDVLISAVRYQETTDAKWVKQPKKELGYKSVQDSLLELPTMEEKLVFEMQYVGSSNLERMLSFHRGDVFIDIKYEELVVDCDMIITNFISEHLELDSVDHENFCQSMKENSLFGDVDKADKPHIKDGGAYQYKKVYTPLCYNIFSKLDYDKYVVGLGYSLDNT